jgi:hypothetical protein
VRPDHLQKDVQIDDCGKRFTATGDDHFTSFYGGTSGALAKVAGVVAEKETFCGLQNKSFGCHTVHSLAAAHRLKG